MSPSREKLDIFEHDVFGYVYWASWQPGNRWQGWICLNCHRSLPTSVTAISRSAGKIDLFVVDDHNCVETAAWDSAAGWRGWQTVGDLAVPFSGRPNVTAVSRSADKLDIFAVGEDGHVYTAAWQPGFTGWRGWRPIPGVRAQPAVPIAAVSRVTDFLDIFVVDINGTVQMASWQPGFTAWSSWHPLFGVQAGPHTKVTAVKWDNNFVNLFFPDVNGNIQTTLVFPAFAGWNRIGEANPAAVVTGVSRRPGRLDVFVAEGGLVWHNGWESVYPSTGWQPIRNFVTTNGNTVTAVSRSLDVIDLYAVGIDYNVWTAAWEPDFGDNWNVFPLPLPIQGYP